MADIFGNTRIEELDRLANDIGRNNEHGEPDPKGSWSSNRQPTQDTFYCIISHIWNWQEVVRFWNCHTNPDVGKLAAMKTTVDALKEANENLHEKLAESKEEIKREHEARLAGTSARLEALKEVDRLAAELHDRDMEVMALKAKLYDLMMKEVR